MKRGSRDESTAGTQELLQELAILRNRLDEATEQFSLGVKARIDEIRHAMGSKDSPHAGHVLAEPRLVQKMVRRLKLLSRRPPKGRAKDLKRIQDLVASLSEAVLSRK